MENLDKELPNLTDKELVDIFNTLEELNEGLEELEKEYKEDDTNE